MTLRSKIIRLARENPGLRPVLLPMLKESAKEKPVSKKAEFEGTLQERINDAVRKTGFMTSDDLIPYLRVNGDPEAADFLQLKLDENLATQTAPAYRALNNVRNDIEWHAKGLYIRDPVKVRCSPLTDPVNLFIFFNDRMPRPIATLKISDSGAVEEVEVDSVQIGKLLDIQKSKIPNPKVDGLLSYLRKVGATI